MNDWQKFILETLAGFETPTTNETKSPDTPGTGCLLPQSELQPRGTHVVDDVKPLKRGGSDSPLNMQWQTKAAAKAKDKWE
jgi:hypothetical protein